MQQVFGLEETPRIARGREPVTVHPLSPAMRPVQITRDLKSFWQDACHEVRKDLRARYPKYHWPEGPLKAQATNRTRHQQKRPK